MFATLVLWLVAADPAVLLLVNGPKGTAKMAQGEAARVLRANSHTVRQAEVLSPRESKLLQKCRGEDACVRAIAKPSAVDAAFMIVLGVNGHLRMVWYDVVADSFDESRVTLNHKTKLGEVLNDFVKAHALRNTPREPSPTPVSATVEVAQPPATTLAPASVPIAAPRPSPAREAAPPTTTRETNSRGEARAAGPLTITGLVLAGVGIATLATAAGFGAASLSQRQDVRYGAGGTPQKLAQQRFIRSNDFALYANIGFVAGGVVAATGVALVVVDWLRPQPSNAVAVAPLALGDGFGGVVHGSF